MTHGTTQVDRDALYYPYIHFRNTEWLKRTLLVFPHVYRMVPDNYDVRDNSFVRALCNTSTARGPLIDKVDLTTPNVTESMSRLYDRVMADFESDRTFVKKFNKTAADALKRNSSDPGFQMHPEKVSIPLMGCLLNLGLAWHPDHPDHEQYYEMHPRIGQAVLSTAAVACAEDAGLNIVTDSADIDSQRLNRCLALEGADAIYDEWIKPTQPQRRKLKASSDGLLELIIYAHCDPNALTPESLAALADDREPLARLKTELESISASVPEMLNENKFRERLSEKVNEVLRKWKQDKANISNVAKQMFGIEGFKNIGGFMQTLADRAGSNEVWSGSLTGTLLNWQANPLLGAAAGFAIGLLVHAGTSFQATRQRAKQSPFRYLSMLEKAGVVFTVGKVAQPPS